MKRPDDKLVRHKAEVAARRYLASLVRSGRASEAKVGRPSVLLCPRGLAARFSPTRVG